MSNDTLKPSGYAIETRCGRWFTAAERIGGYFFEATERASYKEATVYGSKKAAQDAIKRNNLQGAHVEAYYG